MRPNQLGRLGAEVASLVSSSTRHDEKAASLIGSDGPIPKCAVGTTMRLAARGFLPTTDPTWSRWKVTAFPRIVSSLLGSRRLFPVVCPQSAPVCPHELVAPSQHLTLRGVFRTSGAPHDARGLPRGRIFDNTVVGGSGRWVIDPASIPKILYIIDSDGEILVGREERGIVKHSSLAAGSNVFCAGELGFLGGQLLTANLFSGHYMGGAVRTSDTLRGQLRAFVNEVFRNYERHFGTTFLHSDWYAQ